MGKGDKKTKRGKIVNGSYGRLRRRKKLKTKFEKPVVAEIPKEIKAEVAGEKPKVKKTAVKKVTVKKAMIKKTTTAAKTEETETKIPVAKKPIDKKPTAGKTAAKPKKEEVTKPKTDKKEV